MKIYEHQGKGLPQDVANVVAFLVSDEASYMTGQAIDVTGGLWMNSAPNGDAFTRRGEAAQRKSKTSAPTTTSRSTGSALTTSLQPHARFGTQS